MASEVDGQVEERVPHLLSAILLFSPGMRPG